MNRFDPVAIEFGTAGGSRLVLTVNGYVHPERAEPANLDPMHCSVTAYAGQVEASFHIPLGLWELLDLREYLEEIRTGNGPPQTFVLANGLLTLSFAPSRRGPVLCAVSIKTIDASHLRLEFMVTMEPQDVARAIFAFSGLRLRAQSFPGSE